MNNCLIIPAGGTGKRFGSQLPKQFHKLNDIPVIIRTINAFNEIDSINTILIPVPEQYIDTLNSLIKQYKCSKPVKILIGGAERQDSVYNALQTEEAQSSDLVLIHDAVRPFVGRSLIEKLISVAAVAGGAVPAMKLKETIREIRTDGKYNTLERKNLRSIQTPQVFRSGLLLEAFSKAKEEAYLSTDDAALFEYAGFDYVLVEGEEHNIKITSPEDFLTAEFILGLTKKKYIRKM
jgi:2-C-methyl-D-erythritol 4-phosphate cytidylyltransferase